MHQSDQNESVLEQKINELKTEKHGIYMGIPSMGNSHETDSTHPYHYFKDSITIEQLEELTYHEYPMVRVYAFLALKEKPFENMAEVIKGHLTDTTKISVSHGCVIYSETIADLVIYEAFHSVTDEIRDLIFYEHPDLKAHSDILSTCEGYTPYYDRIKQINQESVSKSSLMALASFRKEEDLDFLEAEIRKLEDQGWQFQVIEKYPHSQFKPILEEYKHKLESDSTLDPSLLYLNTLASYKNEWSNKTFSNLISTRSKDYYRSRDRLQEIMKATEKHDTSLYKMIRIEAYKNLGEDTLNIDYFDYGMFSSWW